MAGAAQAPVGTALGVPCPCGSLTGSQPRSLTTTSREAVAVQSWPTGFWPDGSVKWPALAVGTEVAPSAEFTDAWLQYSQLREAHSRLTSYAAAKTGDASLAAHAWQEFYTSHAGYPRELDWWTERGEPPDGPEADRRDELCVDQRRLAVRPGRDPVPPPVGHRLP